MRSSLKIFLCVALIVLAPALALAVSSKITSVEVYLDRAQVTRTADVKLNRGEVEVNFCGLPASLDNRSVQVWGSGAAKATLEGVTVDLEPAPEVPEGRVADLKRRIEELWDQKKLIEEKRMALAITIRMLADVRPERSHRSDSKTSWGNIAEIERIAMAVVGGLRDAFSDDRRLAAELRRTDLEINALNKELKKIRRPSGDRTKCVTVNLSVSRAGSMKVTFSYLLPGASWKPLYDIRALPDEEEIEITSYAQIIQRTGEDWTDVSLSVSTAKPHIGGTPPKLDPLYLVFYHPPAPAGTAAPPPPPRMAPMDGEGVTGAEMAPEEALEEEVEVAAEIEAAQVRSAGTAVFFEVKQKKTIPSDGEPHRVPIAVDKLSASFEHASWPEAKSIVFLRAKTKNETGHPFVAGKANVFVGPSFIGTTNIDDWTDTEEKTLSLGIDQGVRIKRKQLKRKEKETGSKRTIAYEYLVEVKNFKRKSITIEIFDRVPISRQGDIEIKVENILPEPAKRKDNGILMWRIDLAAGASAEVRISYTVRFPKDRRISGLP